MTNNLETHEPVVESSNQPDYSAVDLGGKSPTAYSYVERRAELLQIIQQEGHPAAVNQSELAERYGVSQQQISKDLDSLDEHIRARLPRRRDLEIGSVLRRAMTGLLEEGEYYQAAKVAETYDEYLDRRVSTLEFRQRLSDLEAAANVGDGGW